MSFEETGGVDPGGGDDVGAVQEAERAAPGNTTSDGRTDTDRATDGAAVQEALESDPGQAVLGAVAEQVGGEEDAEAAPTQAAAPVADAAPPDPDAPYAPTPPPDSFMQRMREQVASGVGRTVGEAQAIGGWAGDMIGGAAAAAEAGYEAAVSGIEAATDWIGDEYAQAQRDDLTARAEGLRAAAEEVLSDPAGVARAFAESYEARYAQADALEGAYRSGHADLTAYREAERIRGEADTELAILGVETAAMAAAGAGAIAKGLRAARIADRLDDATPLALAMAQTQRARAGAEAIDLLTDQPGRRAQFDLSDVAAMADARADAVAAIDAMAEAGSIRNVNPLGGRQNCVNCSIATDATLAGRPASALDGSPTSVRVLEQHFGGRFERIDGEAGATEFLTEAGPGARAIIYGTRERGQVGHVFNGVNQGGTVRFLDGQSGRVASFEGYQSFGILRTDAGN